MVCLDVTRELTTEAITASSAGARAVCVTPVVGVSAGAGPRMSEVVMWYYYWQ
jgi:hypothetical protein